MYVPLDNLVIKKKEKRSLSPFRTSNSNTKERVFQGAEDAEGITTEMNPITCECGGCRIHDLTIVLRFVNGDEHGGHAEKFEHLQNSNWETGQSNWLLQQYTFKSAS